MNLIEAIKSGKPFRRKSFGKGAWWKLDESGRRIVAAHISTQPIVWQDTPSVCNMVDDIKGDDWEIQEREVAITRSQFWEVFEGRLLTPELVMEAARKFGLEDK